MLVDVNIRLTTVVFNGEEFAFFLVVFITHESIFKDLSEVMEN
jgi:hypothetical protein